MSSVYSGRRQRAAWAGRRHAANGSAPAWAEAVLRQVTVADRPVAKAVVVDADNTLWGGVCGEVGPEQVEVDGPFRQVQEFLSEQARAGRALALCSRNNVDDLRATFAAHPDMPLTLDDFATVHATWGRSRTRSRVSPMNSGLPWKVWCSSTTARQSGRRSPITTPA